MTDHDTPIRYRPDGSIDTAYYMQQGRRLRSEKAHQMLGTDRAQEEQTPRRWRRVFGFAIPERA